MNHISVEIASVSDIGKYAKFTLIDGREIYGKYGYFSSIAYYVIGQENIKFPIKVRLDELGLQCFHVEAIWHKGLWIRDKRLYQFRHRGKDGE